MRQVNLRLPEDLLARVDVARGGLARERWLRYAVELALAQPSKSLLRSVSQISRDRVAVAVGVAPVVSGPASSASVKRNVKPISK